MTATQRTVLDQLVEQTKKEQASEMKESDFFEYFCATALLAEENFEVDEIKHGLVGFEEKCKTGSDGGLDAIYVLINRQRLVRTPEEVESLKSAYKQDVEINVLLVQASREEGFSMQRLLRLKHTLEDIFSLDREEFSESYNQPLLEAIWTFRTLHKTFATKHVRVHVQYFYMNRGDTDQIAADVDGLKREIECNTPNILATIKKCEIRFIGAQELFDLANRKPIETHELKCSAYMSQDDGKACAVLVKLSEFYRFISTEKNTSGQTFLMQT